MKLANRLKTLKGARLGFLHNKKNNSAEFVQELAKCVSDEASPGSARTWTKSSVYRALPAKVTDEILSECDALVVGPSDCGHGSACSLHDIFEFEHRGLPVAWVDTPGKVPKVERVGGEYTITYAANVMVERNANRFGPAPAVLSRVFEEFGFHRALRLVGAKPGDTVRVGKVRVKLWPYPPPQLRGSSDGLLEFPYIEIEKFRRASAESLRASARRVAPQVIRALLQ